MSNRNFDASWVTRRNRDKNVAQQIYGAMQNGIPIGNPMTINLQVSNIPQFDAGIETTFEKGLNGGYSFNLGGIANYVDNGPTVPVPQLSVPDAPIIVSSTPGNLSAIIIFTAPIYDGGSAITSYEYSLNNGNTWTVFSPAIPTSPVTISGLSVGFNYLIAIRAVNAIGSSLASNIVSVDGKSVPSAPLNLGVIPGIGQASVYFTPPLSTGGLIITDYQYSIDNGSNWISSGTTTSPITINGLVADGTIYTVLLRAVNSLGAGSSSTSVLVASLSSFSPDSINNMNLWLDAQQPSSVVLSSGKVTAWNDSYSSNNNFTASASGIINYTNPSNINNRPALNFTTSAPSISTYLSKSFNISSTNQLSVFMVVRQTGKGASGNSELFYTLNDYRYFDIFNNTNSVGILSVNIGNATQQASGVNIITNPASNALISLVADTNVDMFVNGSATSVSSGIRGPLSLNNTLNWALSAGAFLGNIGEVITYSTPLTTTQRQQVEGYLAWKWGTQDSLPIGHPYRNAPPSITVPSPPTGLSATAGNTTATISFTPGSDGGSSITNYKYSTNGTTYTALSPADTSSPITITGLTNDVTYNITLKAVNAVGDSVASASVSVTPAIPSDKIADSLTTSLSAYNSANTGDWVSITSTEWDNLQTNITGTVIAGASNTVLTSGTSGGLSNSGSAIIANSIKNPYSTAIPVNSYVYGFRVKFGSNLGTAFEVSANTNTGSNTGFSRLGNVISSMNNGINYFVQKGVSATNGATTGNLGFFTGTKLDYPNPSFTGSSGYIGFYIINNSTAPNMLYKIFNDTSTPTSSTALTGNLGSYGVFAIQALTTATKQWA
jgi:titin